MIIYNAFWLNRIDNMKKIQYFIFVGDEKLARLLIHNGANFTIKNKQGKSASDMATEKGIPWSESEPFQ